MLLFYHCLSFQDGKMFSVIMTDFDVQYDIHILNIELNPLPHDHDF